MLECKKNKYKWALQSTHIFLLHFLTCLACFARYHVCVSFTDGFQLYYRVLWEQRCKYLGGCVAGAAVGAAVGKVGTGRRGRAISSTANTIDTIDLMEFSYNILCASEPFKLKLVVYRYLQDVFLFSPWKIWKQSKEKKCLDVEGDKKAASRADFCCCYLLWFYDYKLLLSCRKRASPILITHPWLCISETVQHFIYYDCYALVLSVQLKRMQASNTQSFH